MYNTPTDYKSFDFRGLKLGDRMKALQSLRDYKLDKKEYVLCHIDGRAFSKLIKHNFELPFDDKFIDFMNQTAIYLCKSIQGCKLAYVQSDEISLLLTDFSKEETGNFFQYRLCKLQSVIASLATGEFNRLWYCDQIINNPSDAVDIISSRKPVQFDCKAWNVYEYNDAFAWFKFRQNDCIRNSKQQAAQTYVKPKKKLVNLSSDQQIELLKNEYGIDWNEYSNGKKYGRLIRRCIYEAEGENPIIHEKEMSIRYKWVAEDAPIFTNEYFEDNELIPKKEDE
ncbi:MAG: tRNA(His) guanylyltransferase Thg1 family protein [Prevotella sp.]|nr:tRNA(His) guanylyltransferase Thg1 family protein [Prevotella sp.]